MKFSMTGQVKCDLLIQVTAWAGLTVYLLYQIVVCQIDKITCVFIPSSSA
jgi:hypothetical protein